MRKFLVVDKEGYRHHLEADGYLLRGNMVVFYVGRLFKKNISLFDSPRTVIDKEHRMPASQADHSPAKSGGGN